MLTLGIAYAIGYEPYRLAAASAVHDLLARLARSPSVVADPKMKRAVEFATKGAAIEQKIAAEKATAIVARANANGAALPEIPAEITDAVSWIAAVETQLEPMLKGSDVAIAFDAGRAAAGLMEGWTLAEKLAYLRAAAPDQPALSAEAGSVAARINEQGQRILDVLARIDRPMVVRSAVWIRQRIGSAPRPDAAYAEIIDWKKDVDGTLTDLERDFDVPTGP